MAFRGKSCLISASVMEGSEGESVFDSLNLNPYRFMNEVLNAVEDLVEGAFDFYKQQASELIGKMGGCDRSAELNQGISLLLGKIQSNLDKRLGMWEKYCVQHCFDTPAGFSLPKAHDSCSDSLLPEDVLSDAELDAQLDGLREQLFKFGRESVELHRQHHVLEKEYVLSSHARSAAEALEPFQQNSIQEMFKETENTAAELRRKLQEMNVKRRENVERNRIERIYISNKAQSILYSFSASLKDLQEFSDDMKNM